MDPLPKDANMGPTVLGVATTMVFIGVFLWILRMWARMPKTGMTLGWDDFFITLAIVRVRHLGDAEDARERP